MSDTMIHQSRRFTVTLSDVRSARDIYTLDAVSHAKVRHPVFIGTATAVAGLSGAVGVWWDHLYDGERLAFVLACALALFVSSRIARLQLLSLELRDHTFIFGESTEIFALKGGIEKALVARARVAASTGTPAITAATLKSS